MGQYCYLINKKTRISVEAYKLSGGGKDALRIEDPEKLTKFMEHCRINNLSIDCVSEHYFTDFDDDIEHPYNEFK